MGAKSNNVFCLSIPAPLYSNYHLTKSADEENKYGKMKVGNGMAGHLSKFRILKGMKHLGKRYFYFMAKLMGIIHSIRILMSYR